MDTLQQLLALPAALVTALMCALCGVTFVYTLHRVATGDGMEVWQAGLYLAVLAFHAGVFGYGHLRAVRALRRLGLGQAVAADSPLH